MKNPLLLAAERVRRAYWFVSRIRTVGVLGLVIDDAGRVLLVEQTYRHGWFLPGGAVRRKEGLENALRRELREEVGVEPTAEPRLHGVYWNFVQHKSDYIVVFVVDRWRRIDSRSFEIEREEFFAVDSLPDTTSPAARRRVGEYARGSSGAYGTW